MIPIDKAEIAAQRVGPPARLMLFLSLLNLVMGVYFMVRMILLKKKGLTRNCESRGIKRQGSGTPDFQRLDGGRIS